MADTITTPGIITSFAKTPQAGDDTFYATEDYLTAGGVLSMDVMSNDLGGNAKKLWSIAGDDGNPMNAEDLSALLAADPQTVDGGSAWQLTAHGNLARIYNGQIEYKLGTGNVVTNVNALAWDETLQDTFTYSIRLGNGTLSAATVSVTIEGNNDAVLINAANTSASGAVVEDANATPSETDSQSAAGTISFTDVDLSDGHTATSAPVTGGNATALGTFALGTVSEAANAASGSVGWTYTLNNGAAQYLAAGISVTEIYTVTVADGNGSTVTQDVTVTITGTNDVVSITTADASGAVVEDANATPSETDSQSAAGTISFTDVDLSDGHTATSAPVTGGNATALGTFALGTVSEAANAASGSVGWTYTLNNGAAQYLAAGISVTEIYTVTVNDGNGSTTTQNVTVTITGTNDVPDLGGISTGSVTEDATTPNLTTSGALTISDVDTGQSNFTAQGSTAGSYGTFTLDAAGNWTYTASNSQSAIQNLNTGQSLTDSFTAVSSDGSNNQVVTVTINGVTDAPAQVVASLPAVCTGVDPNNFDSLGLPTSVTLTGNSDGNLLYGGSGADNINGNGGDDLIYGGSGNDDINGNNNNDTLYGGSGNDTIDGSNDNDLIIGGYGADTITGGNGSDTIRYLDLCDTGDTIRDFRTGTDKIDLSAIDANTNSININDVFAGGGLQTGQFVLVNSVTWFVSGGNTVILADTDGDTATAEFSITLTGVTNLALTDFNTL